VTPDVIIGPWNFRNELIDDQWTPLFVKEVTETAKTAEVPPVSWDQGTVRSQGNNDEKVPRKTNDHTLN